MFLRQALIGHNPDCVELKKASPYGPNARARAGSAQLFRIRCRRIPSH
jgi:hypothetical protein